MSIHRECPCEYESTDECAICRDRNTVRNMYSIEEIKDAFYKSGIHPMYKVKFLDILQEND